MFVTFIEFLYRKIFSKFKYSADKIRLINSFVSINGKIWLKCLSCHFMLKIRFKTVLFNEIIYFVAGYFPFCNFRINKKRNTSMCLRTATASGALSSIVNDVSKKSGFREKKCYRASLNVKIFDALLVDLFMLIQFHCQKNITWLKEHIELGQFLV